MAKAATKSESVKSATINYLAEMTHWPPVCKLVHLEPGIKKFDIDTGEPVEYNWVAVQVREEPYFKGDARGVTIFAATEEGDFYHEHMIPIATADYGAIHSVLKKLGYDVTN
jgi:hypothetical protein